MVKQNLCVSVCTYCFLSYQWALEPKKRLAQSSLHSPCRYTLMRFPLGLLFARSLSPSSKKTFSILSIFVALCYSLLHWAAQNWTKYCRCGLITEMTQQSRGKPAGSTLPNTAQDTISLLCSNDMLLTHA